MDAARTTPLPLTPVTPLGGPLPSLTGRAAVYADASGVNTHASTTHTDPSPTLDEHFAAFVAVAQAPTLTATLRAQLLRLADAAQAIAAALPADLKREDAPQAEKLIGEALRQLEVRLIEALRLPPFKPNPPKGR